LLSICSALVESGFGGISDVSRLQSQLYKDETYRELNQQVNEVKRKLNSFIQKLTAQIEYFHKLNNNYRIILAQPELV